MYKIYFCFAYTNLLDKYLFHFAFVFKTKQSKTKTFSPNLSCQAL